MSLFRPRPLPSIAAALPLLLALSAAPVLAAGIAGSTDPVLIDNAVAAFTGQPIGVPGGAALPVDRRLRLSPCRAPLALSWRGDRRDSVLVQCPDAGGWRLFVAVAGPAAGAQAANAVTRGEPVTITVTGDGFSVSQTGEAMDSGPAGGWIRVRTSARANPLQARIVRPGLVDVPAD